MKPGDLRAFPSLKIHTWGTQLLQLERPSPKIGSILSSPVSEPRIVCVVAKPWR